MTNINLASLTSSQGFTIIGVPTPTPSNTGYSVSGCVDFNGDGYNDAIIGAPDTSGGSNNYDGETFVIYGGNTSPGTLELSKFNKNEGVWFSGGYPNSYSGCSVSGIGDFNGDGYSDIIIGAPYNNANEGTSYIIYGGPDISNIYLPTLGYQGLTITGANAGDESGWSVAGAGDVNGDGYDDVIIGAWLADAGQGAAYIIYGQSLMPSVISLANLGAYGIYIQGFGSSYIGTYVSKAGDVNGDGYYDVLLGDHGLEGAFVIYGNASLPRTISLLNYSGFYIAGAPNSNTGWSVSGTGDINNDGYDDIVIGAPATYKCYIIYGNSSILPLVNLTSLGTHGITIVANTNIGLSTGMAGDVNGDGYADVIVGTSDYEQQTGISYVIYGGNLSDYIDLKHLNSTQGFSLTGANVGDHSSYSVSGTCDVNSDGFDDIVIGAYGANSYAGMVYVIYGGAFESAAPTSYPTHMPTTRALVSPSSSAEWYDSLAIKIASPIGSFLLSVITGWILREKVAFYILDNWGHQYKLIYKNSYVPLQNNEIGLRINENQLVCIINNQECLLPIDDSGNSGISKLLHDTIMQALENFDTSKSFTLIQSEKNQIRNYLINHKYILPKHTCLIASYQELGFIKGAIYKITLDQFEDEHLKTSRKEVRHEILGPSSSIDGIEIKETDTKNPIIGNQVKISINKNNENINVHQNMDTRWSTNRDSHGSTTSSVYDGDIEPGFGKDFANSIISSKKSIIKTVESKEGITEPKQDSKCLIQAVYDFRFDNPAIQYAFDNGLGLKAIKFDDVKEEVSTIKAITEKPYIKTSTNIETPASTHILILLNVRNLIEYIPLTKYAYHNIIYPLVGNYLPESAKNMSYPGILESKAALFTAHLATGITAAMLMPTEVAKTAIVTSSASSVAFGVRLATSHYLAEYRQDKPVDVTEGLKQCAVTVFAYTIPSLATCALAKAIMSEYQCTELNLWTKLSFAGSDCYAIYKATHETTKPSIAETIVPYVVDAVAAVTAYANGYGLMEMVASVVASDWMSRMALGVVPKEIEIFRDDYFS